MITNKYKIEVGILNHDSTAEALKFYHATVTYSDEAIQKKLQEAKDDYKEHIEPYSIMDLEEADKFPENPTKDDYINILEKYPEKIISEMILKQIPFPGYGNFFDWTEYGVCKKEEGSIQVIENQTQDFLISVEPVIE